MNTDIPALHQYCGISRQTPSALSEPSLEKIANVFEQDRGPHFGGKNGNIGRRDRAHEKRTCPRDVHEHVSPSCTTVDLKTGMLKDYETVLITEDAINYCKKHPDVLEIKQKTYAFRRNLETEDVASAAGPSEIPPVDADLADYIRSFIFAECEKMLAADRAALLTNEPVKKFTVLPVEELLEDDYSDMPPLEDAPPLEDYEIPDDAIWRRLVVIPIVSRFAEPEMEEVD